MHRVQITFVDPAARDGDEQARGLLLPKRGSEHAAGLDLVAANPEPIRLASGARSLVPTGVAIALPIGLEAQVRPRSGLALKHGVTVLNAPGTIDADYRGEVGVVLINHGDAELVIERGMRVAQLVVARVEPCELEITAELPDSARGDGGFGSTGHGPTGV
jgi:dUTP pyrophosphatase